MTDKKGNTGQEPIRYPAFLYLLSFLLFLLPIKFGSSWYSVSIPSYPIFPQMLFESWPTYFLTMFATAMLIAAIIIYRPERISPIATITAGLWFLLCISSVIFGYSQSSFQFYCYSINQLLTVFLFILLLAICLEYDQRSRRFFTSAVCGGLLYAVLAGIYQYFWGFDEVIALYNSHSEEGRAFQDLTGRVNQTLVYSTFTLSNNFAAHLILVMPLLIYSIIKNFNKDNVIFVKAIAGTLGFFGLCNIFYSAIPILGITTLTISCVLFLHREKLPAKFYRNLSAILILAVIITFLLTRSRAAIFCLFAGLLFCGLFYGDRKQKTLCAISLFLTILGAFILAPQVASFQARLGYYDALVEMFTQKPLGYGFGRFSEVYNQLKGAGVEECNIPHAFFLGFLAQGGFFSGLAVLLCFLFTFKSLLKSSGDRLLKFCLAVGFTSWFLHAQLDVNVMIPGSLLTVGIIALLNEERNPKISTKKYSLLFIAMIPVLGLILYFHLINASGERKYSLLHSKIVIAEETPSLGELKNALDEITQAIPYSTASYKLISHWSVQQFRLTQEGDIRQQEYLLLAKYCAEKALIISPHETDLYAHLADIYYYMNNYKLTLSMLDKAFHYYPYSPAALQREQLILKAYINRQPENMLLRQKYLNNLLKSLEITLGKMDFNNKLRFSVNQLKDLKTALDKQASNLYTEMDFIIKSGFKLDLTMVKKQLHEIINKAKKIIISTQ